MINWLMPSILALCLVLAAVLNLLAARQRRDPPPSRSSALEKLPTSAPPPSPLPAAYAPNLESAPDLKGRLFVGADITPQFLVDQIKDHTEIQAATLIRVYVGKWMRFTGAIYDISEGTLSKEMTMVSFSGNPTIIMRFGKELSCHLYYLRCGHHITH